MIYQFRSIVSLVLFSTILGGLSGCQLWETKAPAEYERYMLSDLKPAVLDVPLDSVADISPSSLINHYTALLPLLKSPEEQMRVLHRLADLKLHKGELLMADQAIDELDIAVDAYTGLLDKYPDSSDNDEVLYQLAKTYDLKGMQDKHLETLTKLVQEYPQSRHYIEVQFRRGELLFSNDNFYMAQLAFDDVAKSENAVFKANALYMHGWSLFKQSQHFEALKSYTKVLDLLLINNSEQSVIASREVKTLVDVSYQTLVADLLRVMSLSVSYLGGSEQLDNLFKVVGAKTYEHIIYASYAAFLDDKEQYSDALGTYKHYIARNPLNIWSPVFQLDVLDVLQKAGFKKDVYREKLAFIDTYGIRSNYWAHHVETSGSMKSAELNVPREHLESLLLELADRHYVKAQGLAKKKSNAYKKEYLLALRFNEEFLQTYPNHKEYASRVFLIAESYLALREYEKAISNFELAGYGFPEFEKANEAAYASILSYQDFSKTWSSLTPEVRTAWKAKQQSNRLMFVDTHFKDKRAVSVLFSSATYTFQLKNHAAALSLSDRLLAWPTSFEGAPALDKRTKTESYLIKAHSEYALKRYSESEVSYQSVLGLLGKKDKRRPQLIENLAASVFNQAELKLANQDMKGAIVEFLRVGKVAPTSSIRPNAEYDAASYLIELKSWEQAISVLNDFRKRYPKHELINTIPPKLALAYRETKQWENAASELKRMRVLAKTEDEKKDLQFIVAELYDKANNKQQAILSYRLWANTYADPADVYMEVTNRLAELYEETDKPLKRRFWLAKQMKKVDQLGDKADDRMRFLAAKASSVLANDAFYQYKKIKLKLPLNKSLEKKTKALEKALKAFQKTASYGIASYSTEAGYRMADIYAQLSRDLMDSDRPDGLNELELEQYEILLEEQAFPFEDSAIEIHEQNASRSWAGIYDDWVKNSFESLKVLLPGRYDKPEVALEAMDALF